MLHATSRLSEFVAFPFVRFSLVLRATEFAPCRRAASGRRVGLSFAPPSDQSPFPASIAGGALRNVRPQSGLFKLRRPESAAAVPGCAVKCPRSYPGCWQSLRNDQFIVVTVVSCAWRRQDRSQAFEGHIRAKYKAHHPSFVLLHLDTG